MLTVGIALAGALAFRLLPVSPLPQIDFATISVTASMPGGSPSDMASAVAAPLEKHLGQIADVTEMTSQSGQNNSRITLQFGLDRDIDGAARDVEAAINAARADLPSSLKSNPTYRKFNPADSPIMVLALTSTTRTPGELYDIASNVLQQRLSQLSGIGNVDVGGSALPGVRVELNPKALFHYGIGLEDVRAALASANANSPKGAIEDDDFHYQLYANDQASRAAQYKELVVAYRNGSAVRLSDVGEVVDFGRGPAQRRPRRRQAGDRPYPVARTRRQHHQDRRRRQGRIAAPDRRAARRRRSHHHHRSLDHDPRLARRYDQDAGAGGVARHPRRVRVPAQRARLADPERRGAGVDHRLVRARCTCWASASTTSR